MRRSGLGGHAGYVLPSLARIAESPHVLRDYTCAGSRRTGSRDDGGATLLEVLTVIALSGILLTVAVRNGAGQVSVTLPGCNRDTLNRSLAPDPELTVSAFSQQR